ncbi:MAG TPA: retropepsin-like aspartic protease [Azospirillaceae bacterium]|nr:retropepsin-like aspartic protease [Azospirillaceae bacterium]
MASRWLFPAMALLGVLLAAGCTATPPRAPAPRLERPLVVPVAWEKDGLVVHASVNGSAPLPFIFDSGLSEIHVLSRETARRLGVEGRGWSMAGSWSGYASTSFAEVDELELGGLRFGRTPVAIMDLPESVTARKEGPPLAGFLGQPLFRPYAVTVDVAAGTLTLSQDHEPPAGAVVLPIRMRGGLPRVPARFGEASLQLDVDTGDFGEVTLYENAARRLRVLRRYGPGEVRGAVAAGGPFNYIAVRADGFRLGVLSFDDLELHVAPFGVAAAMKEDGTVGMGLLGRFRFTLDQPAGRLVLEPRCAAGGGGAGELRCDPSVEPGGGR